MSDCTKTIRHITIAILLATAAIWIAWDFVPFVNEGSGDTISEVIAEYAMKLISIPLMFGVLMGHFFFLRDGAKPKPKLLIPIGIVAIVYDAISLTFGVEWMRCTHAFVPFLMGIPVGALLWPQQRGDKL